MFVLFLFLFYFVQYSTSITNPGVEYRKISNGSSIIVRLKNYTLSDNAESIEAMHTLLPKTYSQIIITEVPLNVHFVVLQVHSYLENVTLSNDPTVSYNNSITGTNVGLIKINSMGDMRFYLFYNGTEDVDIMVAIQGYGKNFPIPGGCNMEFPIEISPFLQTTYNEAVVSVDFAPAAPPISVLPTFLVQPNNECNIKPSPVQYKMYHHYLPERDFSKETYFNVLKSLMTKEKILKNGVLVKEKLTSSPVRRLFASYPGTGNAFVVISTFQNQTSVYVPSITYSCSDLKEYQTCSILPTIFSKILCASVVFVGLVLCLFGHFFFKLETFFLLFLANGIVSYIIFSFIFSTTVVLSVSVGFGFFVAVALMSCFSIPIVSFSLATLTFGFFLASIIMNSVVDFSDILVLDINHWGIFIGIVLACPFLMACLAEKANMISCSFLGACITVMSIDYYLGSNLRYIILNTIRRATVEKFNLAIIEQPYQWKDFLLSLLWLFLTIIGKLLQRMLTMNSAPYPVTSVRSLTETTPLLKSPQASFSKYSNKKNFWGQKNSRGKYKKSHPIYKFFILFSKFDSVF